jgi:hypothetical protein
LGWLWVGSPSKEPSDVKLAKRAVGGAKCEPSRCFVAVSGEDGEQEAFCTLLYRDEVTDAEADRGGHHPVRGSRRHVPPQWACGDS